MNNNPTVMYILATPKMFHERRLIKSLDRIVELCGLARLGHSMNGPHYAPLTPKKSKKWRVIINFASTEDLLDFERLIMFRGYLTEVAKHTKGSDQGIERKTLTY